MQKKNHALELPFGSLTVPARTTSPVPRREEPEVLSVGELDRRLRRLVEGATNQAQVLGETSGVRGVASGHVYFSLKDEKEDACIDCVMYRAAPARARKLIVDGARVVATGRATVYAPRGRLQFVVDDARPAGRGQLLEALEELKSKLQKEGLFSKERKRPMPEDPKVIGVITSPSGAAIHDIVKVAFRRAAVRIVLCPAQVQGQGAAQSVMRALDLLEQVPDVELIIFGRGGGSTDDLSAFNDEALVRRLARTRIPVVSAVGHEIDVTLSDLVADFRAATPSHAAEMVVADATERIRALEHWLSRLGRGAIHQLRNHKEALRRFDAALGGSDDLLAQRQQALDEKREALSVAMRRTLTVRSTGVASLSQRLHAKHPRTRHAELRGRLGPLEVRLVAAMRRRLANAERVLQRGSVALDGMSPLRVLSRGYAIATRLDGRAVRSARDVAVGETLRLRLHEGDLAVNVLEQKFEPAAGDLIASTPVQGKEETHRG